MVSLGVRSESASTECRTTLTLIGDSDTSEGPGGPHSGLRAWGSPVELGVGAKAASADVARKGKRDITYEYHAAPCLHRDLQARSQPRRSAMADLS